MLRRDQRAELLAAALLAGAVVVSMGLHYGFASLLGHFGCDLYQPLADGFRQGQLRLPLDGSQVAIFDSTLWRGDVYLHHAPFPAALYALVDAPLALVGLGPFPKVLLFVVFLVAHVLAVFFLLRRLAPRGVTVAFGLSLSYALSYPFVNLAVYEVGASEVGILYATTLVLLGALAWCRYAERPSSSRAALVATLLACAALSRPTTWAYAAALLAATLILRRLRRDVWVFAAIVFGAIGVYLAYNAARFGDPADFGDRYSFAGLWEVVVDNHGILPIRPDGRLVRVLEALEGWFGLAPPPGGDAWTLYIVSEGGAQLAERLNLLLLGLVAGLCVWLRALRRRGVELALLAGMLGNLLFYVALWEAVSTRYVMDVWPALFLLSVGGLHRGLELARDRWQSPWPARAFVAIVLLSMAATHTGRHGLFVRSRVAGGFPPMKMLTAEPLSAASLADPSVEFCPAGMLRAEHGRPDSALACSTLERRQDDSPPPSWTDQERFDRLGLYRQADGRCFMLFFAGATLWRPAEPACRVELHLDQADQGPASELGSGAAVDCGRIELHLDGEPSGTLSRLASSGPDRLVCGRTLPSHDRGVVRAYFLFRDGMDRVQEAAESHAFERGRRFPFFGKMEGATDARGAAAADAGDAEDLDTRAGLELRAVGGRFGFHEIRVECEPR